MSKFDELISNLKKDIQSLPSIDGSSMPKRECDVVVPVVGGDAIPVMVGEKKTRPYAKMFVRHGLLSVEFAAFFFVFLSITKPSFLYYKERVIHNGREMIKTRFSFAYLISYSIFFTCIIHVLILIQYDLARRYYS